MSESWDLIAIGGGSGGLAVAQRAAEYGARVVLIESGRLGGTCVNVGCVPKKVMWNAATLAHALHDAREYGFALPEDVRHDWSSLTGKRDAYVQRLNDIYAANLERKGIRLIRGFGSFRSADTVEVNGETLQGRHIVIATGGFPSIPDIPGIDLGITSDGFFELRALPSSVAVLGSGYIAVELAGVLASLGSRVTLFARGASVLRQFDEWLQQSAIAALQADGVELRLNTMPERITRQHDGFHVRARDGGMHGPFERLLCAVGRSPATAGLKLDAAGIRVDSEGCISTDDFQETGVAGVYAIGDVTGRVELTPVAIAAGRRLADRLFGGMKDRHLDYKNIPSVVFTHPPLGSCGLTEPQARQQYGETVKVYQAQFVPLYNGVTSYKPKARMKLITADSNERVVGCHISGPGADEILQGFAVAIRMGATKRDLDDTVAIHPTLAEELVTMR